MEQRLAELDEWDRLYGLGAVPGPEHRRRHRRPRAGRRRRGRSLAVLLVLGLVGVGLVQPDRVSEVRTWAAESGRRVLGVPQEGPPVAAPAHEATTPVDPDTAGVGTTTVRDRLDDVVPDLLPRLEDRAWGWNPPRGERVLPAVDPQTDGAHAFLGTQPGTDLPVGFSPCGPVEVVVNPDGAPTGHRELVEGSLARISSASGLHLDLVGETDETWSDQVRERGEPVLVSWATADEVSHLAGPSAGFGGPTFVTFPDGRSWHATGQVVLDRQDLPTRDAHAAVLDHELGHVLGLDHVDAPGELMAAWNTGQTHYGPGDLAGLARLGAIPCP